LLDEKPWWGGQYAREQTRAQADERMKKDERKVTNDDRAAREQGRPYGEAPSSKPCQADPHGGPGTVQPRTDATPARPHASPRFTPRPPSRAQRRTCGCHRPEPLPCPPGRDPPSPAPGPCLSLPLRGRDPERSLHRSSSPASRSHRPACCGRWFHERRGGTDVRERHPSRPRYRAGCRDTSVVQRPWPGTDPARRTSERDDLLGGAGCSDRLRSASRGPSTARRSGSRGSSTAPVSSRRQDGAPEARAQIGAAEPFV
jgi:hypothetical protein